MILVGTKRGSVGTTRWIRREGLREGRRVDEMGEYQERV